MINVSLNKCICTCSAANIIKPKITSREWFFVIFAILLIIFAAGYFIYIIRKKKQNRQKKYIEVKVKK